MNPKSIDNNLLDAQGLISNVDVAVVYYADVNHYLCIATFPSEYIKKKKQYLAYEIQSYTLIGEVLY